MPEQSLREAALWYAGTMHWPIFPLHNIREGRCSCGISDCKDAGKHPRTRHGLHDASTDREQIERWWKDSPDANIGVATGARAGFDVLDEDPRHRGDETLRQLEQVNAALPVTIVSRTGGGGRHFFFLYTEGLKNSTELIGPGLDFRTTGGYVILPPSMHLSGRSYSWEASSRPAQVGIATLPPWCATLARGSKQTTAPQIQHSRSPSGQIPEGQRNSELASLAGSMRRRGMDAAEILPALVALNSRRCTPPLSGTELRGIADSVARYEAKDVLGRDDTDNSGHRQMTVDQLPLVRDSADVEIRWVWDQLIAEGTVTMLSGDSGVGKSTLATALLDAVAGGKPFLGRKTFQRSCLILDRENHRSLVADRLNRLGIQDGPSLRVWGGWAEQEAPDPAHAAIREWILSCYPKPLIVVDSLIAFNPGAENDSSEMRRYLHGYRRLADLGASIAFIHHSGKSEGTKDFRGSSDIKAAVDAAYLLSRASGAHFSDRPPPPTGF